MGPSTPLRVLGGEAPAMCVGPMVLPLILWFVSHQGEMNRYLDGFVPRHDAKREWGLPDEGNKPRIFTDLHECLPDEDA